MFANFIKYPRFYRLPILYQKILKITLNIWIIILTGINSISYTIQGSKLKRTKLQI